MVDECFDSLKTIKLSGPRPNAWRGQIAITVDGKPTSIACITKTCSGSTTLLLGNIVVEADSDSKSWGDTRCLNGNKCSLSWTTTGFICFKHNDIYCLETIKKRNSISNIFDKALNITSVHWERKNVKVDTSR